MANNSITSFMDHFIMESNDDNEVDNALLLVKESSDNFLNKEPLIIRPASYNRNVARKTDIVTGVCKVHGPKSGKIITGSNSVLVESLGIARKGDIVQATCGHIGYLVQVSETVQSDGLGIARVGDIFAGIYTGKIINGSKTVNG